MTRFAGPITIQGRSGSKSQKQRTLQRILERLATGGTGMYLKKTEQGRKLLPEEFEKVWQPIERARAEL